MKLKLTDLDPHFLTQTSKVSYEHTDDIHEADGLMMQCPACFWASRRTGGNASHVIVLWGDPMRWAFIGRDYRDLSLAAGHVTVGLTAGACHSRFYVKNGRVDFY